MMKIFLERWLLPKNRIIGLILIVKIFTAVAEPNGTHSYSSCRQALDATKKADGTFNIVIGSTVFAAQCTYIENEIRTSVSHQDAGKEILLRNTKSVPPSVKNISYAVGIETIKQLVDSSYRCQQSVKVNCWSSRIGGYSWITNRHFEKLSYWAGGPSNGTGCACGITKKCHDASKKCNCDSNDAIVRSDDGAVNKKSDLPITSVIIGDVAGFWSIEYKAIKVQQLECFEDVNECLRTPKCHANATCHNTAGSYNCVCKPGYNGDGKKSCADNQICGTLNCHSNATCINTDGQNYCQCKKGFKGDGKTCRDVRYNSCDSALASNNYRAGNYLLNAGDELVDVYCQLQGRNTKTVISHADLGKEISVSNHNAAGSFEKKIPYKNSIDSIIKIIDAADSCKQNITLQCYYSRITDYSWITDRGENRLKYWAGGPSNGTGCSCGVSSSCHLGRWLCNCDSHSKVLKSDNGVITNKNVLPMTSINIGDTGYDTSQEVTAYKKYAVGDIECLSDVNECASAELNKCSHFCNNTVGSYICSCPTGYVIPVTGGKQCVDVDECALGTHQCHENATCTNTAGSYACSCNKGYLGNGRNCTANQYESCRQALKSNNYTTGLYYLKIDNYIIEVTCEDTGYEIKTAISHNESGKLTYVFGYESAGSYKKTVDYAQDFASIVKIIDRSSRCHQLVHVTCQHSLIRDYSWLTNRENKKMSYWAGGPSNGTGCACGKANTCAGVGTKCNCDANDSVVRSDMGMVTRQSDLPLTSINVGDTGNRLKYKSFVIGSLECFSDAVNCNCSANTTCLNTDATHICGCKQGYAGSGPNCKDINECASAETNKCSHYCNNTVGSYTCSCPTGYVIPVTGGKQCADVDECMLGTHQCHENANCTNTNGSYICQCNNGYSGDGRNCRDVDECASAETNKCSHYCNNTVGSYTCSCPTGYVIPVTGGKQCADVDECMLGAHQCHDNASCTNINGSYTCQCNKGYSGDGRNCTGNHHESCSEALKRNNFMTGKYYLEIDNKILEVTCKNKGNEIETAISHKESGNLIYVSGYESAGSYKKILDYAQDLASVVKIIDRSYRCQQSVHVTCRYSLISEFSWLTNRENKKMSYWAGGPSSGTGCACGITNTCARFGTKCNCDANDGTIRSDTGMVTRQSDLPIMSISTGDTGSSWEYKRYRIGSLECFTDVDECAKSHPCHPNATCTNTPGLYKCECNDGFSGDGAIECLHPAICNSLNCPQNANCANTNGSHFCKCKLGYQGNGSYCSDVNECASAELNKCSHFCNNTVGSYTCSCPNGYVMPVTGGRKCADVDECALGTYKCHDNATCTNTIGSYRCLCNKGFLGDGKNCTANHHESCLAALKSSSSTTGLYYIKIDNNILEVTCKIMGNETKTIISHKDSGKYIYVSGYESAGSYKKTIDYAQDFASIVKIVDKSYRCQQSVHVICRHSLIRVFSWLTNRENKKMSYWAGGPSNGTGCACGITNTCAGQGTKCNCDANDYTVRSDTGMVTRKSDLPITSINTGDTGSFWEYKRYRTGSLECFSDADSCAKPQRCHANATCTNTPSSFSCKCNEGFSGNGATECLNPVICKSLNCSENAACVNPIGTHFCKCKTGYQGNGSHCVDMDECSALFPCHKDAICNNTMGSFICSCKDGFLGDGKIHCTDINECASAETNKCSHYCNNTIGSYICSCPTGYVIPVSGGKQCADVDECMLGTHQCHDKASCTNTAGSYICQCNKGYSGDGRNCQDLDECSDLSPCHKDAICSNTIGSFICACKDGFSGDGKTHCADVNECASAETNKCSHYCNNTVGSYTCSCPTGYVIPVTGGKQCADVDECMLGTHQCHENANCTNTNGSYICQCNNGYSGDGRNCKDIDECASAETNQCSHYCNNTVGSYTCSCPTGYVIPVTGGKQCADVDECMLGAHQCHENANCTNTNGSYICQCNKGYSGDGRNCKAIDLCTSYDCVANAQCITIGQNPTCICKTGFKGDGKTCNEDRLFAYDHTTFRTGIDDRSYSIILPYEVPLGLKKFRDLYVCANGYITVGYRICSTRPQFSNHYDLIAPFGTDIDFGGREGGLAYSVHLNTKKDAVSEKLFNQTKQFINQHGNTSDFNPKLIVVATWIKGTPYPHEDYTGTKTFVTFQVNIASDGTNTYVTFVYDDNGMLWNDPLRRAYLGYYLSQGQYSLKVQLNAVNQSSTFRFDAVVGNTKKAGYWLWKLAGGIENHAAKCFDWYSRQPSSSIMRTIRNHRQSDCPCSYQQVLRDNRFRFYQKTDSMICFEGRRLWTLFWRVSFHVQCCYSQTLFSLINSVELMSEPSTQKYISQKYSRMHLWWSRTRRLSRQEAVVESKEAFISCCEKSTLCKLYLEKRPIPDCSRYSTPWWGFMFGDPHIKTLDGNVYTFNGIGDYVLLRVQNSSSFLVHCRMSKAQIEANSTIQHSKATVFSGFAITAERGAIVEIYLNVSTGNVTVLVNKIRYPMEYFMQTKTMNDTEIQWKTGNNSQLSVIFESGVGGVVNIFENQLSIQIMSSSTFANRTRGLIGVSNGDVNDDFTRPDEQTISVNSTQKTIYYEFGKLWEVTGNGSLFTLLDPDYDETFVPMFFDNLDHLFGNNTALKEKAIRTCGGTKSFTCLFDVYLTGDTKAAAESQSALNTFETEQTKINTYPPKIEGPKSLTAFYGKTHNFSVIATSGTSSNLTHFVISNGTDVTIHPNNGNASWFVNSSDFRLTFIVKDEENNTATLSPIVTLCYCLNGGSCNASRENTLARTTNNLLIYAECSCRPGHIGPFCQTVISFCEQTPCFEGVSCTDNYITGSADCGSCPKNYVGDGRKCYDINECTKGVHNCHQNSSCTNTEGSFDCTCNKGFTGNGTHCDDIDECSLGIHNCNQNSSCINYIGGYKCACKSGYTGNGSHCQDIDECSSQNGICDKNAECQNVPGSYICTCHNGFTGNGTHCAGITTTVTPTTTGQDINECTKGVHNCHQNSSCTNTEGSFDCTCNKGFTGNGTHCDDIDECSLGIHNCNQNSSCINYIGGYKCACKSGYTGNGSHCQDIDECSSQNGICDKNADCHNVPGSYICTCHNGFTGNGTHCAGITTTVTPTTTGQDTCENVNCFNGGICRLLNGKAVCDCPAGLIGRSCTEIESVLKASAAFPTMTLNGKTLNLNDLKTKKDLVNMTSELSRNLRKLLQPEFEERLKKAHNNVRKVEIISFRLGSLIVDLKIVLKSPLNTSLADFEKTLKSTFNGPIAGSVMASFIVEDFNECEMKDYCDKNADCKNKIGSFHCVCKSGYKGNGFICTKKETSYAKLALSLVVVCFLLLMLAFGVYLFLRKRRGSSSLQHKERFTGVELHSMRIQHHDQKETTMQLRAKLPVSTVEGHDNVYDRD